MQHIVIVARDRPELFEDLLRRFRGDGQIEVLFDRRLHDDHVDPAHLAESIDRRQSPEDVEARLWVEGYVIVRSA